MNKPNMHKIARIGRILIRRYAHGQTRGHAYYNTPPTALELLNLQRSITQFNHIHTLNNSRFSVPDAEPD